MDVVRKERVVRVVKSCMVDEGGGGVYERGSEGEGLAT